MSIKGADLSDWNPVQDWDAVKKSGQVQFIFSKASEGTADTASTFRPNHDACKARSIPFGAYHFFHFAQDPVAQAKFFLEQIDGYQGQLLPVVDVEGGGQDGVTDLPTLIATLSAFLREVETTLKGKRCIIYTDYGDWNKTPYTDANGVFHPGFMQGTDAFAGHPLWIAEYNSDLSPTLPNGFTQWVAWQYTSSGQIPGIAGNADLDLLNGESLEGISR